MTWDTKTERAVEEALTVANRGRCRAHPRIEDHHPWEAPRFGPIRRSITRRDVERSLAVIATAMLLVGILAALLDSSGWTRPLWVLVGAAVLIFWALTDRLLE